MVISPKIDPLRGLYIIIFFTLYFFTYYNSNNIYMIYVQWVKLLIFRMIFCT